MSDPLFGLLLMISEVGSPDYIAKSAIFNIWVFWVISMHYITLYVRDIHNIRPLEPFFTTLWPLCLEVFGSEHELKPCPIDDYGDDDALDDAYPLQPSNCLFPLDRSCFFLPANRCMAAAPWDFCQLDPGQETRFRKVPPRVIEAPGCWLNILLVHVPGLAGSKKVL